MNQLGGARASATIFPEERAALDLVLERFRSEAWQKIDALESVLEEAADRPDLPLHHLFTPGLYTREIFLPAGTILTTRIHLTRHPFVVSLGVVFVWDDTSGWIKISAPFTGITEPGTRRILVVLEDAIWTTFHVTDETDPDAIVRQMTYNGGKYASLGAAAATPCLKGSA